MVAILQKHSRNSTPSSRFPRAVWPFLFCVVIGLMLLTTQWWLLLSPVDSSLSEYRAYLSTKEYLRPTSAYLSAVRESPDILYFTSRPPDPIPLFSVESIPILQRHACIAKIREQHDKVYASFERIGMSDRALLVDPAYHSNVGDHMITLGELEMLRKLGYGTLDEPSAKVAQCSFLQAGNYAPPCHHFSTGGALSNIISISNPPLAFWHGGGNWGDMWPDIQIARMKSMEPLLRSNYTIISMPQSLYFQKSSREQEFTSILKKHIELGLGASSTLVDPREGRRQTASRVVLSWREHESYDIAQRLYPFATHILVPDIAFQLGPYSPVASQEDFLKVDLVLLLRDDRESMYATQRNRRAVRDILSDLPNGQRLSFSIVDWTDRSDRFASKDILFTSSAIQLLSMGKVVVCDRLHAAILSYLSGIPFVYLEQRTGKITKTLQVAFELNETCLDGSKAMWSQAYNLSDAVRQGVEFLDRYRL
jgi:exopolysaccharide biosynthesis predicted pyruvyltransferase EpsI